MGLSLYIEGPVREGFSQAVGLSPRVCALATQAPSRGSVGDVRVGIGSGEWREDQARRGDDPGRQNNPTTALHCVGDCHDFPSRFGFTGLWNPLRTASQAGGTHNDVFPRDSPRISRGLEHTTLIGVTSGINCEFGVERPDSVATDPSLVSTVTFPANASVRTPVTPRMRIYPTLGRVRTQWHSARASSFFGPWCPEGSVSRRRARAVIRCEMGNWQRHD